MPLVLHWHTEPLLLLTLLLPGWAYALATGPWRATLAPGEKYPRAEAIRFFAGLIVAYLSVGSPLDALGESLLFSAHMTQHMLLIYVVPPLLITGLPVWLTDPFLEKRPRLLRVAKSLTHPAVGGGLFVIIFSLWHFPELYVWAMNNKAAHILEHWMMFIPAMLMTWPIVSRSRVLPPLRDGSMMVYGFVLMVGDLPLWAAFIFGNDPIYRTYEFAPRLAGITPIQDQIHGAIIMKLFNEGFSMLTMGCAFFRWAKKES